MMLVLRSRRGALHAALGGILGGALRLAGLLALAAVPAAAEEPPPPGRTLVVVGPWEVGGLDPASNGHAFTRLEVAETLVGVDASGAPAPGLATGWTVSPDGLAWRFPLRADVRFHDGSPLTAEVAAESLRRAWSNVGPLARAPIAAITAADGAVVVALHRPFALLPAFLANHTAIVLAPASYDAGASCASSAPGPTAPPRSRRPCGSTWSASTAGGAAGPPSPGRATSPSARARPAP